MVDTCTKVCNITRMHSSFQSVYNFVCASVDETRLPAEFVLTMNDEDFPRDTMARTKVQDLPSIFVVKEVGIYLFSSNSE